MGYLVLWVTRTGIQPVNKKVESMVNITPPIDQKQVCSFIGLVNYYMDIWGKRSYLLQLLTALTSNKVKFKWTPVEQNTFNEIKQIVTRDALLIYPNLIKCFDIHRDATKFEIGAVISQDEKAIAFYSCKLTGLQKRYTVTEKELLSIVETLKEFFTVLFCQSINIYTDHKTIM